MKTKTNEPKTEQKIVVTFDICSSTAIIEDLHKTENTVKWIDLLIWMDDYLNIKSGEIGFFIYKFTGDGWLLFFEYDFPGNDLIDFLQEFCKQFKMRYKRKVEDFLETPPTLSGLTFGIDRGSIISFMLNGQKEFIGRPINVACRLQGAIKDKDKVPQYKALITKHFYQNFRNSLDNYERFKVKRKLRNIAGGIEMNCIKIKLLNIKD